MNEEQRDIINKLVWFIPFKKQRNALRSFLLFLIENMNNIDKILKNINIDLSENKNLIENTNQRLDSTNQRLDSTNQRLDSTNQRLDYINIDLSENKNIIESVRRKHLENKKCDEMQNNKVIYTCVTNNYDDISIHSYIDDSWDYICFTDSEYLINRGYFGNWKVKPLEFDKLDNTRNNRWHKMHPHVLFQKYERSLYVDANLNIKTPYLFECIFEKEKQNIKLSIPKHFERECIYDEANIIKDNAIDDIVIVENQINLYENEGFPKNYGLSENNIIYRNHNDEKIISIMNDWWYMIENYSKRDQLSLYYVLWKNNFDMPYLTRSSIRLDFPNFEFKPHNKSMLTTLQGLYEYDNYINNRWSWLYRL